MITFNKMKMYSVVFYVMKMDLINLKTPSIYFPFISMSLSLAVKDLCLYFGWGRVLRITQTLKKRGVSIGAD